MNTNEIRKKYLDRHNALGTRKDAIDKELFDQQHRQVWQDCDVELEARKTELVAKTILNGTEELELRQLRIEFPDPSPPVRNLLAEIDVLKAKVAGLEAKSIV